jgi:exonuclease III
MEGITTYLSILTVNINGLKASIKRRYLENWIKKDYPEICCLQAAQLIDRNKHLHRVKGWKNIYKANAPTAKKGRSRIFISDKSRFQTYIGQMR